MAQDNNNVEEDAPQPQPFPERLLTSAENKAVGHMVRDYLWGKGPIDYLNVSGNMNREPVLQFVQFELESLPPQYYWRVRILADLYNLKEILGFIQSKLNRQEKEPVEMDRSIAGTIMLYEIGDTSQKQFAVQYYNYLVAHSLANQKFAELIECLAALGNSVSPNPLFTRMEGEIKTLRARESSDPAAGVKSRQIEDLLNNEFFFIDEANKSKRRLSEIEDQNKRLLEMIKVYLEMTEDGGGEYINLWTQQQIRRTAEDEGKEKAVEAFRFNLRFLSDSVVFSKVRTLNAIEFFLGILDVKESDFMDKNSENQVDPLRFIPLPLHAEEDDEDKENEELDIEEAAEDAEDKENDVEESENKDDQVYL